MRGLAAINLFRWEVLTTLTLIRFVAKRLVPEWRESFPDPNRPFSWRTIAPDRRSAYKEMVEFSWFGAIFITAGTTIVFLFPASALGFPLWSQILSTFAIAAPVLVSIVGTAFGGFAILRISRSESGCASDDDYWRVDMDANSLVFVVPSLTGILLALGFSLILWLS